MKRLLPLATACSAFITLSAATSVVFTDITDVAGIRFTHNNGAFGEKYLPETFGSGILWLDVNADGWQDCLLLNGTNWPERDGPPTHAALYRNEGNGTFTDITAGSGLDIPIYGLGGSAADFDNDGFVDVYLTALGMNRLFKGRGDGTFSDVTETAGVGDSGFSTSALWVDYDKDGHLDLFVGNYVEWSPDTDLFCSLVGDAKSYCTPESYQGQSPTLFRNRGDQTFEDVTTAAGVRSPSSKVLGVAMLDFDDDGWMDLFLANDTQPDQLFRNGADGTFEDIGVLAGVAFSETGVARAGMGVDAADYDRSGRPDLIVGHFSTEMMALFHNEGSGLFIDEGPRSAIGRATLLTLTFGCFFFDFDLDGWQDIFAANGHVADDVERDWNEEQIGASRAEWDSEYSRFQYYDGQNPHWPEKALALQYQQALDAFHKMEADDRSVAQIIADNQEPTNPVFTKVLTQVMFGSPQYMYHGGLLRATVRYFDADRMRPGLPLDVAALVDELRPDGAGLQLVNSSRGETRRLIVQAGAFGEHDFTEVTFEGDGDDAAVRVNGKYFLVELPPSTSVRVDAGMRRFVNQPSYAFPWHGGDNPIPFP